jgi:hypothetical protein
MSWILWLLNLEWFNVLKAKKIKRDDDDDDDDELHRK